MMAALQVFALGVLADLIASHRVVSQRTLERVRRIELELGVPPSHYIPGRSADSDGDTPAPTVRPAPPEAVASRAEPTPARRGS
jgi:hypothetical protein